MGKGLPARSHPQWRKYAPCDLGSRLANLAAFVQPHGREPRDASSVHERRNRRHARGGVKTARDGLFLSLGLTYTHAYLQQNTPRAPLTVVSKFNPMIQSVFMSVFLYQ